MKNALKAKAIFRIAGIIALIAVIGFSMVACDSDGGGGGGNSGGGNTPSSGGSGGFTLTGIPSQYNGKGAVLQAANDSGLAVLGGSGTPGTISWGSSVTIKNGSVSFPLWTPNASETGFVKYSGNDTFTVFISIFDEVTDYTSGIIISVDFDAVKFSNGNATRSWSSADSTY